jgi:DNA-binding HxlR family transcriptional regulator
MQTVGDYCSFEKAVEHLADRWIFLIVRELAMHGPRGFNAIVEGLPGINRSVLSRRLHTLEDLGLIVRASGPRGRIAPYRLSRAGEQLVPTLRALNRWAEQWVPEDPAAAQVDTDVITFWLSRRADPSSLPDSAAVLEFQPNGPDSQRMWLVLERGVEPSLCIEDPLLPEQRYVHVEADPPALYPLARGLMDWYSALAAGDVRLFGEPGLVRSVPTWFRPPEAATSAA